MDVRIISATNRHIENEVQDGTFREDLYYRLNVVKIQMPPLRERKEDIPLLADHFLNMFKHESGYPNLIISKSAMEKITEYDWPGNVRELKNAMERAVVMGNGREILPEDFPIFSRKPMESGLRVGLTLKDAIDQFKMDFIEMTLRHTNGNRSEAAKLMDIQRTYLSRLIAQYQLEV